MMQVTHCTLYNYQLGDQQHTPITGYNINSYTNLNVHATMLNMCSVYLSHVAIVMSYCVMQSLGRIFISVKRTLPRGFT